MNAQHETTLDKFGRIVIPKEIREALGLQPGSLLKIEQRGGKLALCPISEEPRLILKGGVLVARVEPLQDLKGIERKFRQGRVSRLAGLPK